MRRDVVGFVGLLITALASPAWAQEAPKAGAPEPAEAPPAAAPPAAAESSAAEPTEAAAAIPEASTAPAAEAPAADEEAPPAPATPAVPEEPPTGHVAIMVEPILAAFGFYEGEVDVTLTETVAVGVWGQYFDYELLDTGLSGFGVGLGAPIFLKGKVYRGLYVQPLVKFQKVSFDVGDADVIDVTYWGPMATVGYQWTFGNVFSLKLGAGAEYSFGKITSDAVNDDLSFEGIDYEIDIMIGAAF